MGLFFNRHVQRTRMMAQAQEQDRLFEEEAREQERLAEEEARRFDEGLARQEAEQLAWEEQQEWQAACEQERQQAEAASYSMPDPPMDFGGGFGQF